MYIYLSRESKRIIASAMKTLDLNPEDAITKIKDDECIKTDEMVDLIENLNYKIEYLEEKMEDLKDGKEL